MLDLQPLTLWKHRCVKSVQLRSFFWSVFSFILTEYGIYGVNLRNQSEYRKIRTRKTSVFGHFSRSAFYFNFESEGLCLQILSKRINSHFCLICRDNVRSSQRDKIPNLNRSNNFVFLRLKFYWNRQVVDLIRALGIWNPRRFVTRLLSQNLRFNFSEY